MAELLRVGRRRVLQVMLAQEGPAPLAGEIASLARAAGVPLAVVEPARLRAQARTESPQGVVALAEPLRPTTLAELVAVPAPFLVVLDGVTDPQNLGAVMRTASCAGATGVVIPGHRSAGLTPAAMKAAAGAAEHLPVATVGGIPAALSDLRGAGVWTLGLDAGARSSLWGLELAREPLALVLGSEGSGLGQLTRRRLDLVVGIPIAGPIGSLNVAAAAAVACFEVARQRKVH